MLDCLVIGGGHCGLMCGYLLATLGVDYQIVDASARAGDTWRCRPKNLRLFTSRQFCRLADLSMPGDPRSFPSGTEFADHVERFCHEKSLNVLFGTSVVRLSLADGCFVAETGDGTTITARTVINATGSNQKPALPEFSRQLGASVRQISASEFGDASDIFRDCAVVVVGDGASGRQIAMELATQRNDCKVSLARGRRRKLVPNVVLGRDVFWWLDRIGLLYANRDTLVARLLRERDPIPAASVNDRRLAIQGVTLKPRAVDAEGDCLIFSDGSRDHVDVVIWCTGYQENLEWIDLPSITNHASLSNGQGRTDLEGFFVIGRKWLTCRASELIMGCERDARTVTDLVRKVLAGRA